MTDIPADLSKYSESPIFTEATVPEQLMESHETKPGTWARIQVLEGKLQYQILGTDGETKELSPDQPGIVAPTVPHKVKPLGAVRFQVEFYR